jgi:hypothetical protein
VAWLEETMGADPPGLIVANPGFAGPGGQEFGHAETVLAAAARADASRRWPFDTASPAAIVKTQATLKSADAQAWSKRATGYELRGGLKVPDPRRTAANFILIYELHNLTVNIKRPAQAASRWPASTRPGVCDPLPPRARLVTAEPGNKSVFHAGCCDPADTDCTRKLSSASGARSRGCGGTIWAWPYRNGCAAGGPHQQSTCSSGSASLPSAWAGYG